MGEEHESYGPPESESNRSPNDSDSLDIFHEFFSNHPSEELRAYLSGEDVNEAALVPTPESSDEEPEDLHDLIDRTLDEMFPVDDDFFVTDEPLPAHEQISMDELLEEDPHQALQLLLERLGQYLRVEVTEFTIPIGELLLSEFGRSYSTLDRRTKHPKLQQQLETTFAKIRSRLQEPAGERKSQKREKLTREEILLDHQTYEDFRYEINIFTHTYDMGLLPYQFWDVVGSILSNLDDYLQSFNTIVTNQEQIQSNVFIHERRYIERESVKAHEHISNLIPIIQRDLDKLRDVFAVFIEEQTKFGKTKEDFLRKPKTAESFLRSSAKALLKKLRNIFLGDNNEKRQ